MEWGGAWKTGTIGEKRSSAQNQGSLALRKKSSGRQHTRESMEIQVKREVSEELE